MCSKDTTPSRLWILQTDTEVLSDGSALALHRTTTSLPITQATWRKTEKGWIKHNDGHQSR